MASKTESAVSHRLGAPLAVTSYTVRLNSDMESLYNRALLVARKRTNLHDMRVIFIRILAG